MGSDQKVAVASLNSFEGLQAATSEPSNGPDTIATEEKQVNLMAEGLPPAAGEVLERLGDSKRADLDSVELKLQLMSGAFLSPVHVAASSTGADLKKLVQQQLQPGKRVVGLLLGDETLQDSDCILRMQLPSDVTITVVTGFCIEHIQIARSL